MHMTLQGSVTGWIGQLKAGDQRAAQELWERYFDRLVRVARKKLGSAPRRAADEEDVVLSAFHTLCRGAERGRFPKLHDRDDLWRLLVVITARKAVDQLRRANRVKHGGGKLLGESAVQGPGEASSKRFGMDQLIGTEPTPEFAALVAEEYRRLLDCLDDATLRSVALWKMEGYTADEIAKRLGCVTRTAERKLRAIRTIWSKEIRR